MWNNSSYSLGCFKHRKGNDRQRQRLLPNNLYMKPTFPPSQSWCLLKPTSCSILFFPPHRPTAKNPTVFLKLKLCKKKEVVSKKLRLRQKRHRENVILSLGCQDSFSMGYTLQPNLKEMRKLLWWKLWLARRYVEKNPFHGDEDHMFALFRQRILFSA